MKNIIKFIGVKPEALPRLHQLLETDLNMLPKNKNICDSGCVPTDPKDFRYIVLKDVKPCDSKDFRRPDHRVDYLVTVEIELDPHTGRGIHTDQINPENNIFRVSAELLLELYRVMDPKLVPSITAQ